MPGKPEQNGGGGDRMGLNTTMSFRVSYASMTRIRFLGSPACAGLSAAMAAPPADTAGYLRRSPVAAQAAAGPIRILPAAPLSQRRGVRCVRRPCPTPHLLLGKSLPNRQHYRRVRSHRAMTGSKNPEGHSRWRRSSRQSPRRCPGTRRPRAEGRSFNLQSAVLHGSGPAKMRRTAERRPLGADHLARARLHMKRSVSHASLKRQGMASGIDLTRSAA